MAPCIPPTTNPPGNAFQMPIPADRTDDAARRRFNLAPFTHTGLAGAVDR